VAANEDTLGALHTKVAQTLSTLLDGTEIPTGEEDEEGNEIKTVIPPSAAVLTASIQFLKNNNITCTPAQDNALGELEAKLKERAQRMKTGRADMVAAREDTAFLTGLPN